MEYFIMDWDRRSVPGRRVDLKSPAFSGKEPSVTWLELAGGDKLPDFLWRSDYAGQVFCVSDEMKPILDTYSCLLEATPVFLTDTAYRNQSVYWSVELEEKDCLRQDYYARKEEQVFLTMPDKGKSLFKARNGKTWYAAVSLELLENLLRRHLHGLCFYPIRKNI